MLAGSHLEASEHTSRPRRADRDPRHRRPAQTRESVRRQPFAFFHFRGKEQNDVDAVIESFDGQLTEASGKRFATSLVLYNHDQIVPFGDRLFAVPISSL